MPSLSARRILIIIIIALIALAVMGGILTRLLSNATGETRAGTAMVSRGSLAATINATGEVTALRQARLTLPVEGEIAQIAVEPGAEVTTDTLLLTLDSTFLTLQLQEAQAGYQVATAQLAQAEAGARTGDIEVAQAQVQAAHLALTVAEIERDGLSEAERDTSKEAVAVEEARAALAGAEATLQQLLDGPTMPEIEGLQAQIAQAQVRVVQAETALQSSTLTAPFAGIITLVNVNVGELYGPGQPLMTLADFQTLYVAAEIDEIDVGRVEPNQAATITFDAFPTQPLSGTVEMIARAATPQRNATTYVAQITFPLTTLPLRLDMAAQVEIRAADADAVLLLPQNAIRYAESLPYVVILRDGSETDQPVSLGASDGIQVEILEGVNEGEIVILP